VLSDIGNTLARKFGIVFELAGDELETKKLTEGSMKTSTSTEECDLLVLGSGGGGKVLAGALAQKGQRAVVVERKWVGGSCPNIACLPSKNIIHSAKVASFFYRSNEFGISKDNVHIDMAAVRERKRKMVVNVVDIFRDTFYTKTGAELVMGTGRFIGPKTIEVSLNDGGTRTFRGKIVVLNTGSRATIDPIPGLAEANPLTHIEALELDHVPKHLLVLGAGYVGLELAQAFRRFGAEVTLIDRNGRLAHNEDEDTSQGLEEMCRDEGITVVTNAKITRVEGNSGEWIRLLGRRDGAELTLEGTHLLVAAGRTPNTSGIGLDKAGVETTARGHVKVNERLQTTAEGVWAIGDCAGSPHFTHISFDDFKVVSENIAGGNRVTTGRQVPFCIFTDPELARIGLSETEAKERGIPYRVAKLPMAAVLRTMTISETRGFMKALVDTESDRILGFTMFGAGAGELMTAVQIMMLAGLPYTLVRDAIIAHPTMAEGLSSLFGNVPPISAHPPDVRGNAEGSSPEIQLNTAALEQVGKRRRADPLSSIS
jgi:pyruvate/2-oxoglutarate dehydrogenase complex dihydrolipoamide dehydrogenase (E3) component